jgi:hypothetical protein
VERSRHAKSSPSGRTWAVLSQRSRPCRTRPE